MRNVCVPLFAALALVGCDALNKVKSENPVFPPAPPRLSFSNEGPAGAGDRKIAGADDPKGSPGGKASERNAEGGEVRTVALSNADKAPNDGPELSDTQVVAIVDGQPIFASEILDRYAPQLSAAKKQAPPEEIRKLREMLIRRDLPGHIERKILVQNLRATLKPEQLKMLGKALDTQFDADTERMMKALKVETRAELDAELAKQHTTLETLKTSFVNQRMAMEYLSAKSKYDKKIGRRELHEYYDAHRNEFEFPAEVKWQQILISYEKHGSKEKAYQAALKPVIDDLKSGKDFAETAKKYSDGPTAQDGGHRDWIQRGSLDDESIEAALFELPLKSISQVFIGTKNFQIVKVVGRKEAGCTPFEELQDEIKQKVEMEARKEASMKFVNELKAKANIESPFLEREKKSAADPLPFK